MKRDFIGSLTGGLSMKAEIAFVVLFTLLVTVPFIFRPFHMDDAGFLELARVRQTDPTGLTVRDYTFFGEENEVFLDTHPPLISSYLALLIHFAGTESETVLHLAFLIFPLTAAVAMYFLARRYTRHAMLAAMLLMATPAMVVMSHGLMSDVPAISLWLAGIVLYVYGLDRRSLGMMVVCGVVITMGVFTSYQVLSVVPLLFAYAVVRRRLSILAIIPLALPMSSFISYAAWHLAVVGILPRFSYGVGAPLAWYSIIQKTAGAMLAITGAMIFFGALMRVLLARKSDVTVYLIFLGPLWVAALFQFVTGRYTAVAALLMIILMPLGILLLYRLFADAWPRLRLKWNQDRDRVAEDLLLLLWLGGVFFYVIVLLPYSSVRYLLPLSAPLVLLFIRLTEDTFGQTRGKLRKFLGAAVSATAIMGVILAISDYELASAQKEFAYREAAEIGRQAAKEGGHTWFIGEFGYRYYMEQQGFRELPKDTRIPEGDIVIQSPLADPRVFSEELEDRVELVETIGYPAALPVRVTSFSAQAGFYGHFWGLLPFSLASGNVEEFLVYRVVPLIEDEEEGMD